MGYQKKDIDLLNSTKLILGLSDVPYALKWRKTAKNCSRNVGYQKKGIDPLNSEKVILAVSDILYGQNGEKQQNRAKNARMTPVMTPSKLMTVKHGISYT